MKLCLKHHAKENTHSKTCRVTEYPLNKELLDCAIVTLTGRYPEERRVVNQHCDELAYVFQGKGKIVFNDEEHSLNAGDVVLIEAGEKYYWERSMQLFLVGLHGIKNNMNL